MTEQDEIRAIIDEWRTTRDQAGFDDIVASVPEYNRMIVGAEFYLTEGPYLHPHVVAGINNLCVQMNNAAPGSGWSIEPHSSHIKIVRRRTYDELIWMAAKNERTERAHVDFARIEETRLMPLVPTS
jgi:hypothetical protein